MSVSLEFFDELNHFLLDLELFKDIDAFPDLALYLLESNDVCTDRSLPIDSRPNLVVLYILNYASPWVEGCSDFVLEGGALVLKVVPGIQQFLDALLDFGCRLLMDTILKALGAVWRRVLVASWVQADVQDSLPPATAHGRVLLPLKVHQGGVHQRVVLHVAIGALFMHL